MSIAMASPVPQKEDVERWTVEQVAAWLRQMELTDCCEFFLRKGIDGHSLMELTEEGLILWGRDLSVRNRKKILKLIKLIENRYLVATGKMQQNKLPMHLQDACTASRDGSDGEGNYTVDHGDYDSSDDFSDDDVEQEPGNSQHDDGNSGQAGYFTDSSSGEGIYLSPLPAPANRFNPPPPKPFPNKLSTPTPVKNHQPSSTPDKRPPMPLPFNNGANQVSGTLNSNQRFGGHLAGPKLPPPPGLAEPPKWNQQQRSGSFSEPPRRPPPSVPGSSPAGGSNTLHKPYPGASVPSAPKPISHLREWSPKKPSDTSNQNSNQSENSNEGGCSGGRMGFGGSVNKKNFLADLQQKLTPSYPLEDSEDQYEVVENPPSNFLGNEVHSGSPPSLPSPNQAPPPLPQRNHDGRDSRSGGSNLQQSLGSRSYPSPSPVISSVNQPRPPLALPTPANTLNIGPSKISHLSKPLNSPDRPQKPSPNVQPRLPRSPAPALPFQHPPLPNLNAPPRERAPSIPSSVGSMPTPGGGNMAPGERLPLGEGESAELTPLLRTIMDRPYFHVISRNKSKELLENAKEGMYLIRPSTRSSDPLTLCLRYSGRTYNINIRERRDGLYALGSEKMNEVTFSNIDEIISTYTSEPLKLQSGDRVMLTTSPSKSDEHIYVRMPESVRKKFQH